MFANDPLMAASFELLHSWHPISIMSRIFWESLALGLLARPALPVLALRAGPVRLAGRRRVHDSERRTMKRNHE
jgi:hypothetical protein